MPARKALVLALAAAGLAGSASLPLAREGTVFVPELAFIDGVICRAPARVAPYTLLRVAQAGQDGVQKKGISPAASAAAEAVSAAPAATDPPLMQGLGTASLQITTSSPLAQQYFDQGYRLAWAFNHHEALRAFRKAQRLDPQCAMCYWGEAWALGPNINVPMDDKANGPALAALNKATRLAASASAREQALILALAARYSSADGTERPELDRAYAAAMRRVARNYPRDVEIATLYADALMNVSPWDYWEAGGRKLRAPVAELVTTLEAALRQNPDHVGAIHLYIHAVEASDNPRRAEPYADRLARLAPNAGHLVHMPSHIYFVLGRYKDALAANIEAIRVDEAYIAAEKPSGVYPLGYYPHNVHFAMAAAQMGGNGKIAVDSARKLGTLIPAEAARDVLMLQPMKAAPYFAHAQFSDRALIMTLADPGSELPYVRTAWLYARGVALARSGDPVAAAQELARIEEIIATADYTPFDTWTIPARDVARIAAHVLRARIAQADRDLEGAARELRAAVAIEDTLPYMEPAYWYYPVRQSLGAVLLLKGDAAGARVVFGESLARTPNNAWALYGLAQAYAADGMQREAKSVRSRFSRAWMGGRMRIAIEDL
jgi:tetratricopeptide (TPR) repeat protein